MKNAGTKDSFWLRGNPASTPGRPFYKLPFYVFARPSGGAGAAKAALITQNEPGDVRLGQVKVSDRKIAQGQATEVSALLRTRARSASGVSVTFYDGDPAKGDKAFDVERIPRLRAKDAHERSQTGVSLRRLRRSPNLRRRSPRQAVRGDRLVK